MTGEKKINICLIKNCNLLITSPHNRKSKLQEKHSALKREHPALQNMKFLNFFLFLWVISALLDPDPDSESGFGSTDLIESGSNPDPNPKHCSSPMPALLQYVRIISFLHARCGAANLSQLSHSAGRKTTSTVGC